MYIILVCFELIFTFTVRQKNNVTLHYYLKRTNTSKDYYPSRIKTIGDHFQCRESVMLLQQAVLILHWCDSCQRPGVMCDSLKGGRLCGSENHGLRRIVSVNLAYLTSLIMALSGGNRVDNLFDYTPTGDGDSPVLWEWYESPGGFNSFHHRGLHKAGSLV